MSRSYVQWRQPTVSRLVGGSNEFDSILCHRLMHIAIGGLINPLDSPAAGGGEGASGEVRELDIKEGVG